MTEERWLSCTNPAAMLVYLLDRAGPRKLRLFVCGCARELWGVYHDERSRRGIEVAERYADGEAGEEERQAAWTAALEAQADASWDATLEATAAARAAHSDVTVAAMRVTEDVARVLARRVAKEAARKRQWRAVPRQARDAANLVARSRQCDLLRDLFGNPWRRAAVEPAWLAWNGGTVPRMARVIYRERRFEDLPYLGDALEEAGCEGAILEHCRSGGEHARGCHVVDAILEKS